MADLIEEYTVTDIYIKIKFGVTVKVSTIVNENFLLNKTSATPSGIANPFNTINIAKDYNSISRILYLYFSNGKLQSNSPYLFTVSGLTDVLDTEYDNYSFTFNTEILDIDGSTLPEVVFPEPVIVDYAISSGLFPLPDYNETGSTRLSLVSAYPASNAYYLYPSENDGRIILEFNLSIPNTFLVSPFFKVQKREIKKAPTRWVDIDALITSNNNGKLVYVDLPSVDHYPEIATPSSVVVYNESGYRYYEENYKYRVLISKDLAGLTEASTPLIRNIVSDVELLYCGILSPMYIDVDEISSIFTEAGNVEIAENIHYFSLEVEKLLDIDKEATEIPFVAMEYINAAVACSLDKIYSVGSGFNMSFSLGDLSVNKPRINSKITRGNAASWCELAAILRSEILSATSRGGFRSVVRGEKYENPIPIRKIRDFDAIDSTTYNVEGLQGSLDIQL